jgi:pyruvate dehydrogenase E2 component (dihydrolipoamide acetyltransferase)
MAEFKLPELGENVTTGDVVRVLVNVGDLIERDQPVLELETEKATVEVPSSVAGRVREIAVKAGDKVRVGQVILVVEDGAAEGAREVPSARVEPREPVAPAEPVLAGPEAGRPTEPRPGPLDQGREEPAAARPGRGEVVELPRAVRAVEPAAPRRVVPAAPSVRRLARELGVPIEEVPGTGPGGRIGPDDVKAYARRLIAEHRPAAARRPAPPLPDFSRWGPVERKPMRAVRRATAEHVAQAWAAVPHVAQYEKADITALEQARLRLGPRVEQAGGKLTLTAILLKVAAAALRAFPQVNTSIDVEREEIVYKGYVHIGVAVDTEHGLLVPVIRDVDRKGLIELSVELTRMADKARARKLTLEEMAGGCFTITNLGGIGGTYFSPIVNYPEVAILGVARAAWEPVFVPGPAGSGAGREAAGVRAAGAEGHFEPRLMLPLALSYDHRVLDGADAIRFLRWIVDALEQPLALALA